MSFAHRITGSGLVLAEQAMDETAIGAALRQFDQRLSLQFRPPYYVVVCSVSEYEAPVVATWMDLHGRPLPLSSGLLEKVQAWHVGSRNRPETVEEHNARRLVELETMRARTAEAVREDHRPYVERDRTQVSLSDTGKRRYWQRDGAKPKSSGLS